MIRIALVLLAFSAPVFANPAHDGERGRPVEPPDVTPPKLSVGQTFVEVEVGAEWAAHDIRSLCDVDAPGARVRIEEVAGDDAAAAVDVALDGPTTLRLRASEGEHVIRVELSATDARGNQAFDRCRIQIR